MRSRSLGAIAPGNVELHSTPPPGEPVDDCKSSIPGSAARVRYAHSVVGGSDRPRECRVALDPRRPASRGKTTTASRRSRGGAARVRYGLPSPIARRVPRECRVALDFPPAGRPAEDDDCKSSIPGGCGTRPMADCRRRSLGAVPGNVELHSTPPTGEPAEDDDCKSSIPGAAARVRYGLPSSPVARRSPRECRVALDPAADRRAGGRRRLQVVDPGGCGTGPMPVVVADRSAQSPGMSSCTRPPPTGEPGEDDDCKSSIPGRDAARVRCRRRRSLARSPGMSSCTRPAPAGRPAEDDDCKSSIPGGAARVRCVVASPIARRVPRECRVALDTADRRAGGRRRLQVVDPGGCGTSPIRVAVAGRSARSPGMSSCTRHRRPASRGKTTTASRRSRGSAARVRYGLPSPIARRRPRECRVALDPAGRQAGGRRRLQVVDPGSRPGMSDSATRAGFALACRLKKTASTDPPS
jgi:hypothetical protein